MTSTSLHKNKLSSAFKMLFKRNYILLILSAAFSLFLALSITNEGLTSYSLTNLEKENTVVPADETAYLWQQIMIFALLVCGLLSFILQHLVYREAYSKRAADWLFSLPVKRNAFYNAAVLYNIILVGVYYIISTLAYFAVFAKYATYFKTDVKTVLLQALLCFLISVGMLLVCAFAAVLSGKAWHYLALLTVLFLGIPLASRCAVSVINSIWGFYMQSMAGDVVMPTTGMYAAYGTGAVSGGVIAVMLLVEIVLYYVLGLLAFKKRKAEIAEMAVWGKPVLAVTTFIAAIFGFLAAYTLLSNLHIVIRILVGIFVAFALGIFFTAVLSMAKARFLKLAAASTGAAVVLTVLFVLAVTYVPNIQYRDYVPAAADVQSVRVMEDDFGYDSDTSDFLYLLGAGFSDVSANFSYDVTLTSDEAKACVEELHKALLTDYTESASAALETLMHSNTDTEWYDSLQWITFEYTLTDGSVITRNYYADAGQYYEQLAALMQTQESVNNLFPSTIDPDNILCIYNSTYEYENDVTESTFYVSLDDYTPFVEAVAQERQNCSTVAFFANNADVYPYDTFFDEYYGSEAYNDRVSLFIFYITEDATAEEIEKLNAMTVEELNDAFYYSSGYSNLPLDCICIEVAADSSAMEILYGE